MQTAWLIESKNETGAPKWLEISETGMGWTQDANDALKFADKKSAEALGNDYGILEGVPAIVTEHGWPDGFSNTG